MNYGLIGGILGTTIGVIGGIIGTTATIRNTNGPRERAFTVKASIIGWVIALLFVAGFILIPVPYNWGPWVVFIVLLPFGIRAWNRKQAQIRREESGERPPTEQPRTGQEGGQP